MSPLPCRLIFEAPAAGTWNMAVDEALLAAAADEGNATLRFYTWSEPTLSLGYFQPHAERTAHAASGSCPVVRRPSGGGAIVHDRELTYALSLPAGHPLAQSAQRLYTAVHTAVIETLEHWLAPGSGEPSARRLVMVCNREQQGQRHGGDAAAQTSGEPFLCFERRANGDVILTGPDCDHDSRGHKILGSAQRRRQGALLQHGSLLLATSRAAPQLPGLSDLIDRPLAAMELANSLAAAVTRKLCLIDAGTQLPASVISAAARIEADKYASPAWTLRR